MAKSRDKTREDYERWLAEMQAEQDRPPASIFLPALVIVLAIVAMILYGVFKIIITGALYLAGLGL